MDRSDQVDPELDRDGVHDERRDRPAVLVAGLAILTAIPTAVCGLLTAEVWLANPEYSVLALLLSLLNCGLAVPWGGLVAVDADLPKWSRVWGCILAVTAPLLLGCVIAIAVLSELVP